MRRVLGFLAGVLVGQWLVLGGGLSSADLHLRATSAWEHRDYCTTGADAPWRPSACGPRRPTPSR